jgi:hypothetical protein
MLDLWLAGFNIGPTLFSKICIELGIDLLNRAYYQLVP